MCLGGIVSAHSDSLGQGCVPVYLYSATCTFGKMTGVFLRVTAVTRGWNGHRSRVSTDRYRWKKRILPPLLSCIASATFVTVPSELSRLPRRSTQNLIWVNTRYKKKGGLSAEGICISAPVVPGHESMHEDVCHRPVCFFVCLFVSLVNTVPCS